MLDSSLVKSVKKHFVPIDQWEQTVKPMFCEAQSGSLGGRCPGLSLVNKRCPQDSYPSPVGKGLLCSKRFLAIQKGEEAFLKHHSFPGAQGSGEV